MNVASTVSPPKQAGATLTTQQPLPAPDWHAIGFDLRLLESFVALASELHFGRAAERLAFAQPALSQQIRRLEAQLGSALFIRDTRRVELTAAGTAFLPYARASLTAAVDAAAAVAATKRAEGGTLRLSINGDALEYVREFLRAFAAVHAEVQLDVTLRFQDASKDALARHDADGSILWSGDQPPPGFAEKSALVAAPGAGIALLDSHALATLPEVPLERLEGQRLIMFPRDRAKDLYDLILEGVGGSTHFSTIHHITTIGQSVGADMLGALDEESVTPSPKWLDLQRSPKGFMYKPVVPAVAATLWLVWPGVATGPTQTLAAFAGHHHPT